MTFLLVKVFDSDLQELGGFRNRLTFPGEVDCPAVVELVRAAGRFVGAVPTCVEVVTEAGAVAFKLDLFADVVFRLGVCKVVDGLPSSGGTRRGQGPPDRLFWVPPLAHRSRGFSKGVRFPWGSRAQSCAREGPPVQVSLNERKQSTS